MKKRTTIALLIGIMVFTTLLAGCRSGTDPAETGGDPTELNSKEFFAMDTYMEIRGYGASEELLDEASKAVTDLEKLISTTYDGSEIAQINAAGNGTVTGEAEELLLESLFLCDELQGTLDISIYPVVKAWGFTTGEHRIPEDSEIDALLEKVDYQKVLLNDDGTVELGEGMQIDLGAVAKGYTGDMLAELFTDAGITSALFSLGGNVQCLGSKLGGSPWNVGIQDPESEGILGTVPVINKAVVTSGGYERYFEGPDGEIYWHIMDPATGRPAKNGLISATIVGDSGIRCDALSTALFIMGPDKAADFWRSHKDFEMILVTEDHRILVSEGIAEDFTPESGLDYTVETINY